MKVQVRFFLSNPLHICVFTEDDRILHVHGRSPSIPFWHSCRFPDSIILRICDSSFPKLLTLHILLNNNERILRVLNVIEEICGHHKTVFCLCNVETIPDSYHYFQVENGMM
jgi:hypothetical protein